MRTGTERAWCESEFVSAEEVRSGLGIESSASTAAEQSWVPTRMTVVNWRGAPLKVGWITPRSHPFCSRCERLRMDARGQIRRCLMDPATLDLADLLRATESSEAQERFHSYVSKKLRRLPWTAHLP